MIGFSGFDEAVVDGLVFRDEAVRAQQAMPSLVSVSSSRGFVSGPFERSFAHEPLPNEILHVTVGHFSVAAVGMLREVVGGDDAELSKLDDRADFGLAQLVAAIPVVEDGAAVPEMNLRSAVFGTVFR